MSEAQRRAIDLLNLLLDEAKAKLADVTKAENQTKEMWRSVANYVADKGRQVRTLAELLPNM